MNKESIKRLQELIEYLIKYSRLNEEKGKAALNVKFS